jgi:hypothetical protein
MFLYTYIPVNPFDFLIKYGNHCTLMCRRTKDQCYQRYVYSLREGVRHGTWLEVEEWLVLLGQRLYQRDWAKITQLLQTRTPLQARQILLGSGFRLFLNATKQS